MIWYIERNLNVALSLSQKKKKKDWRSDTIRWEDPPRIMLAWGSEIVDKCRLKLQTIVDTPYDMAEEKKFTDNTECYELRKTEHSSIILFAYSLVRKVAASVVSRPNRVKK